MLEGLLFDLDGTLTITDPLHYRVWREALGEHDIEIDESFYRARIGGRLNPDIVRDLLPTLTPEASSQFIEHKEAHFRALAGGLTTLPGLDQLLAWSDAQGLARALVTNAPGENARFMLKVLGLESAFRTVILGEDAPAGKPDPLPYRIALERLDIASEAALAFEDSPAGVRSAVAAGIPTVGIVSMHGADELLSHGALMVIPDFNDSRLWELLHSSRAVSV